MPTLIEDVRYTARVLARSPRFTVVAVLALGLSVSANIAILSVRNANLPHSSIFCDPANLAVLHKTTSIASHAIWPVNYPESKSRNRVFGDLAAVVDIFHLNLTGASQPEELLAGAVSPNFFQLIGVQPVIGRAFLPSEDQQGRDRVVILSHQLWRRRFDGSVGILGKSITLSGETYHVIGVLPPDFSWNNRRTDVWIPFVIESDSSYRATGDRAI